MRKILLTAVFLGAAVAMPASANETEDFCVDFVTSNDMGSTEPCSCVGEVGEANAAVKEEILALASPEDTDNLSESAQEALSVCFPQDEAA